MTEITFLKPVYQGYDSYIDFFRLAELAGFPIRYVNTLRLDEPGVFISAPVNGDWREHLETQAGKPRNAHLILWQLERPSADGAVGKYAESNRNLMYGIRPDGTDSPVRYADEVWVSDRKLAEESSLRYVPLGSHPGLGEPGEERDKVWDIIHLSYEVPRRQTVYKHFVKTRIAPNCWPPERDDALKKSRLGLAVHQDNFPFMEPLRFALFAAYGLPILSETLIDAWPYGDDVMKFAPYDTIHRVAEDLLRGDYRRLQAMGEHCRRRMTENFEFGKVVREAVAQSVGDWR